MKTGVLFLSLLLSLNAIFCSQVSAGEIERWYKGILDGTNNYETTRSIILSEDRSLTIDKANAGDPSFYSSQRAVSPQRTLITEDRANCENTELNALNDFSDSQVSGFSPSYRDNTRGARAIDASQYKDVYAASTFVFSGDDGNYDLVLNTLAELDGESNYRIAINGTLLPGTFTNPRINGTSQPDYTPAQTTWENVDLVSGDMIRVEFSSESNNLVPEGGGFAFSRGRWTSLELNCNNGTTPCDGYKEVNGLVVIEAENLDIASTTNWVETETALTGASENEYIIWRGANLFSSPGTAGVIHTKIQITTPGTYRFQWRSRVGRGTESKDHNDSWLKFPDSDDFYAQKGNNVSTRVYPKGSGKTPHPEGAGGAGWFKIYLSGTLNWTWSTNTFDNNAHQIYVQFDSPGEYTMSIAGRSEAHAIDRIVLYNTSASSPLDLTHSETPCTDNCPNDPNKIEPGVCGCGTPDTDTDNDGTPDCNDNCPNDANETEPGVCGCDTADTDTDTDGTPDCNDNCPSDANKLEPGSCGCGNPETEFCNVGISNLENELDIHIYPNPTSGILNIELPENATNFSVILFDATGRTLLEEQQIKAGTSKINIANYKMGVYFMKITHDNKSNIYRIVKN